MSEGCAGSPPSLVAHGDNPDEEGSVNEKRWPKVVSVSDTTAAREAQPLMPIHARYRWFYPDRLAPTFGRDPLQTSARQMRGVRPPSWKNGLPLGRRALVGSREEAVARRTRQTTPAATRAVAVEGDDPVDARGPRLLASRSRPNQQPALEPEGLLSALPHVARPA